MKAVVLPLVFLTALSGVAQSGAAHAQTTDQASSTIELHPQGEGMAAHIVNRDFVFDSRLQYGAPQVTRLMLEITTDTTMRDDAEGFAAAKVTATAWAIEAAGRRQLWTVSEPGDRAAVSHDQPVLVVRQSGCCGSRDSFSVFGLYSGRRLFDATGAAAVDSWDPWAVLDVPNSGGLERLIAFHAAYSATDDAAFAGRQDVVGILTYAAPDHPLARYRLIATAGTVDSFMGQATVALRQDGKTEAAPSLTLWPADGKKDPKAIGGFAILLQLTDDKAVTIPVAADALDMASVKLPAGLKIEPLPSP
jgi:hypothetical protein